MKTLAMAIAALSSCAAMALAGDLAVDETTLDSMGLKGMQTLSERDGMAIRGKGPLDFVFGEGFVPRLPVDFAQKQSTGFSGDFKSPGNPLGRAPLTLDGKLPGNSQNFGSNNPFGFGGNMNIFPSPLP